MLLSIWFLACCTRISGIIGYDQLGSIAVLYEKANLAGGVWRSDTVYTAQVHFMVF